MQKSKGLETQKAFTNGLAKENKDVGVTTRKAKAMSIYENDSALAREVKLHLFVNLFSKLDCQSRKLPFLVYKVASISVLLAFRPYIYAGTAYATVGGWSSCRTVHFTPMLFP